MKVSINTLPKNTAELVVELSVEETQPYLERAAERLSRIKPPKGFRPGKAPLAMMEKVFGANAIYDEALESIVQATYPKAVAQENLTTIGAPKIEMLKVASGNPLEYKATVALLPAVKLGEYRTLKVHKRTVKAEEKDIEELITQLRETRASEALVDRPAQMGDKVEVDFTSYLEKVPLEGGDSKTHPVILGSKRFVPGFEEQIVGMKKGESKEFTLRFPKEYFKASLADRDVEFKVTLHSVYERTLPEVNDEFAKSLQYKDVKDFRHHAAQSIEERKKRQERDRFELAMLEKIVEISTFEEFPEIMVERETDKMLDELRGRVSEEGMDFAHYLESIKKSEEDLRKEFLPQAERRIRFALVTRAIAEQEKIAVPKEDVEKEIEQTKQLYSGNAEIEKTISTPEYFSYLENMLASRRVYEFLDKLMGVDEE